MARGSVLIELNGDGVRQLLRSPEVQQMLDGKARAVAQAVESRGIKVDDAKGNRVAVPVDVRSAGGQRARATVGLDHPAGLAVEAKHRVLVGSLDAARRS